MKFLEKDLEGIINQTSSEKLKQRGLDFNGKRYRQLRIGNYGIADLVTVEKFYGGQWDGNRPVLVNGIKESICDNIKSNELIITIYELKKDKIGISAYLQALKYVKGIQRYLDARKFSKDVQFRIVLIGSKLDTSGSFCFLPEFNGDIDFYTYSYGIDGLEFQRSNGYKLSDEGFNTKSQD
jgi:hypothetical protein